MGNEPTWHARAVKQLCQIFDREPDARAFILSGSLAVAPPQVDIWSDVDAKIIIADCAMDRYYSSTTWLSPFGRLIGIDRNSGDFTKTLRVCLEGFKRFDLVFIAESALQQPSFLKDNPFRPPCTVIWSRLPDLDTHIAAFPSSAQYHEHSTEGLERMIDQFWFKAGLAITKVMLNDLLIGLHLALDLARDCLVLQMIRRDREKRTTVHRAGGWGNDLVNRFSLTLHEKAHTEVLSFVRQSCEVFDELASDLLSGYEKRGSLLFPTLGLADEICRAYTPAGQDVA